LKNKRLNWLKNRLEIVFRNKRDFKDISVYEFSNLNLIFTLIICLVTIFSISFFLSTTILSKWFDPRYVERKANEELIRLSNAIDSLQYESKIKDLKKCLANSDVVISIWVGNEMVGFGRALTDGIFRGVLWDIVIDQNHQGKGFGTLIVKNLLSSKKIKNTKKLYLMTTNKKLFYSQFDLKEVTSQNLLIREI